MSRENLPRYQPSYRQAEIRLICESALRGESLCFVGLPGIGKSNIVNLLYVDPYGYKATYLGEYSETVHFPLVDCNVWDRTSQGLWQLMLSALKNSVENTDWPMDSSKVVFLSEELRIQSQLNDSIRWLCSHQGHIVMFILDDFDRVLIEGSLVTLESLTGLRSNNRTKLSYLAFTQKLPHILGRHHEIEDKSKFYDLIRNNIYALSMYTVEDAQQMIRFLNVNAGSPLSQAQMNSISTLSGGHAGLIKVLFDVFARENTYTADDVKLEELLQHPHIRNELTRIFRGLHDYEQTIAIKIAHRELDSVPDAVFAHLSHRGLLIDKHQWFSPIMENFLKQLDVDGKLL
jgi:hypothetical protein